MKSHPLESPAKSNKGNHSKVTQTKVTRRALLVNLGAGMVMASAASACAPVSALVSSRPIQAGEPEMQNIQQSVTQSTSAETSFQDFLPVFVEGTNRFINGDPKLWKLNASQSDDATIMGAWGAYEQGWSEVGPRYDWAAARFQESGALLNVEYLASGVSGDLAYTVAIEHSEALVAGQDKPAAMALRVTHLFRLEEGQWKLIHRHADPLIEKTAPASVLQE